MAAGVNKTLGGKRGQCRSGHSPSSPKSSRKNEAVIIENPSRAEAFSREESC